MKKHVLILFSLMLCLGACGKDIRIPESEATMANWHYAKQLQAEGRYELAKQYYLLALTSVQTQQVMDRLERELFNVDLQIRTMR